MQRNAAARALAEHSLRGAHLLEGQGEAQRRHDEGEPLLAESRNIFERLDAKPWLNRLDAVQMDASTEIPA
jgi:hypothetical protein